MTVFAHAGHVLVDLAIYLGPILVIGLGLWAADRRDKRRGARDEQGNSPMGSDPALGRTEGPDRV